MTIRYAIHAYKRNLTMTKILSGSAFKNEDKEDSESKIVVKNTKNK